MRRASSVADAAGIATELVERDRFGAASTATPTRRAWPRCSRGHDVDLVAMAGFGTVLAQPMHDAFGGRMLNTHPALLPAFKGWHAVRDALAYGVKVTGCTVHVAGLESTPGRSSPRRRCRSSPTTPRRRCTSASRTVERRLYPATLRRSSTRDSREPRCRPTAEGNRLP